MKNIKQLSYEEKNSAIHNLLGVKDYAQPVADGTEDN